MYKQREIQTMEWARSWQRNNVTTQVRWEWVFLQWALLNLNPNPPFLWPPAQHDSSKGKIFLCVYNAYKSCSSLAHVLLTLVRGTTGRVRLHKSFPDILKHTQYDYPFLALDKVTCVNSCQAMSHMGFVFLPLRDFLVRLPSWDIHWLLFLCNALWSCFVMSQNTPDQLGYHRNKHFFPRSENVQQWIQDIMMQTPSALASAPRTRNAT